MLKHKVARTNLSTISSIHEGFIIEMQCRNETGGLKFQYGTSKDGASNPLVKIGR